MLFMRRLASVWLLMALLVPSAFATSKEETNALFEQAYEGLQTPAEAAAESGTYSMHPGEMAYFPSVSPGIIPFDRMEEAVFPAVTGDFHSSDETVVIVAADGKMTALSRGEAMVTYSGSFGEETMQIIVDEDVPTEHAKNMAYVALQEYYRVKRARLPKYNQYAKWYYGKKNEVGWCSVFGIWCANAAGSDPVKKKDAQDIPETATLYLREGQVGNQYDGFFKLERFGAIPRVGYMVIYAEMKNSYRTTHIGIVVDVEDKGDGIYQITTVEGNMSNSVKAYSYLYDSKAANHKVGTEKGLRLQWNMHEVPPEEQTNPLFQYALHTDHWSVFGFCETWK